MSRITDFNSNDLWDIMDKHCSMMVDVEQRSTELAKEFGKINQNYLIKNVDFSHDAWRSFVNASFENLSDGSIVNFTYDTAWLFSDRYKEILEDLEVKKQVDRDKEYLEYLRLKKKFEE